MGIVGSRNAALYQISQFAVTTALNRAAAFSNSPPSC